MTVTALTNCFMHVHSLDFTTYSNQGMLTAEAAPLDRTTFGSGGWTELTGGLKSVQWAMSGFWDPTPDSVSYTDLGTGNRVYTVGPINTAASPAYLFRAGKFSYEAFGKIGELAPFSLSCYGTDGVGVARGQLAKAKGNVSATGALGSGLNLGAVGASEYLYATFHVFTAGTTITVVVESDDNSGFTSATTRATIGPLTTTGGTWVTPVAGAITDSYFRFRVTAITGTFSVAGAIATQ